MHILKSLFLKKAHFQTAKPNGPLTYILDVREVLNLFYE